MRSAVLPLLTLIGILDSMVPVALPDESDSLWFRWHYAGSGPLKSDPNAGSVREVFRLPESRRLMNSVLEGLAQAPERQIFGTEAAAPPVRRRLLKAFLEGVLTYESFGEFNGTPGEHPNLSLGVRFPEKKLELWDRNLRRYLGTLGWKPPVSNSDSENIDWTATHPRPELLTRFVYQGEWLLFSVGPDTHSKLPEWNQQIKEGIIPKRSERSALDLRGDFRRLAKWLADLDLDLVTRFDLKFIPEDTTVRTEARFSIAQPVQAPLPSWEVPTKLIADPIVSFSGLRGLNPLIEKLPMSNPLRQEGLPSQVFSWSRPSVVSSNSIPIFPLYLAWPIPQAAIPVAPLTKQLPLLMGSGIMTSGSARLVSFPQRNETILQIMPGFIQPFIRGATNETHGVRVAGLFPLSPAFRSIPQGLIDQLESQENIVYYQWEITQNRIETYRVLAQFLAFLFQKPQSQSNRPGYRWLSAIESKMGNAVTIVRASKPNELRLNRKSHFGLTGLELNLLAQWIEAKAFPFLDKELLTQWEMRGFISTPSVPSPPPIPRPNAKTRR